MSISHVRGVALLSVLVILGIASALIVRIVTDSAQQVNRHKASTLYQQMLLYYLSTESLVVRVLREDETADKDTCDDTWAQPLPLYPVDGGAIEVMLYDINSTININSVRALDFTKDAHAADKKPNSKERITFIAIKEMLKEEGFFNATDITLAMLDWLDTDDTVSSFEGAIGAENNHYLALSKPHRSANQPIHDIRELVAVRDMHSVTAAATDTTSTPYVFFTQKSTYACGGNRQVNQFATIVSQDDATLNVNTASCDTITSFIHAFNPTQNKATIANVVQDVLCPSSSANSESNNYEFSSVDAFFDRLDASALADPNSVSWKKKIAPELFSVTSNYFAMKTTLRFGDCTMKASSILRRQDGKITKEARQIEAFSC